MLRYGLNRVLWAVPVLWLVSTATFILMHLAPGSPWQAQYGGRRVSAEFREVLESGFNRRYGLDEPLYVQYAKYMWSVVRFDWGVSLSEPSRTVTEILGKHFPITFRVGMYAFLIAVSLGVSLGALAALNHRTWIDYAISLVAGAAYTVPSLVLAIFALILFSVKLSLVPVLWTDWRSYILPSLVLGMGPAGYLARLTRSTVLEMSRQDHVRAARAKGLRVRTVNRRHILRNALLPVVTMLGPTLATLVTGSLFVEFIFGIPGTGRLLFYSLQERDYPVIMATTILYTFFVVLGNLAVDILYGVVDPRVRLAS